jgi:hypothetical protein
VVIVSFFGMHLFGHGGHGGCGGGEEPRRPSDKDEQDKDRPQGHQH